MPPLNLCDEFSGSPGGGSPDWAELKPWPALLQCLLGLQCQSRPSAAQIKWLAIADLARVRSSSDSRRPEGIQVE